MPPDLIPVDHDPFNELPISLEPVEHDPWAESQTHQAAKPPDATTRFLGNVAAVGRGLLGQAKDVLQMPQQAWNEGLSGQFAPGDFDYDSKTLDRANALAGVVMTGGMAGGAGLRAGETALGSGPIRAYHGSPHDFERFDTSKIGTGEGAQAYGHGLYFAENEGTAKSYRDALSSSDPDVMNNALTHASQMIKAQPGADPAAIIKKVIAARPQIAKYADDPEIISLAKRAMTGENPDGTVTNDALDAFRGMTKKLSSGPSGKMYEVNIAADPEHFLDWDKPLSEQHPKVQEAIASHPQFKGRLDPQDPVINAQHLLAELEIANHQPGQGHLDSAVAAQSLRQAGIPGIKYLDQGSRNPNPFSTSVEFRPEGDKYIVYGPGNIKHGRFDTREEANAFKDKRNAEGQTHNYVVFDDRLIQIARKYGIAGLIAGGVHHFSTTPVDHDPYAQ